DRDVEGVAQLDEARRLVRGRAVDRAREEHRLVGDYTDRTAGNPNQRGDDGAAKARLELEDAADIGDAFDDLAHIVGAARILRHDLAQGQGVGRVARRPRRP